jgi:hypothetical protein
MLRATVIAPSTLRVVAVACVSMAAMSRPPTLAATAAGVGLVLFIWSLRGDDSIRDGHVFRWAGAAVIVLLLFRVAGPVGRLTESEATTRFLWIALLVGAAALAVVFGHLGRTRRISIALAFLAVTTITVVMTVGEWRSDLGLDVYWMHREAGEAIFNGQNPYTDAVRVSNGSPFAPEGAVIEGYTYPPVVAGTYAVAGADFDPRLVSSVAWLGVLAWLGWLARGQHAEADTAYAMFLMCAGLAIWPVIWFASWTEPLSVGLFMMAAVFWRRRPFLSAVMLGLALASKQFFIFLAPLLLLHRDEMKYKRLGLSVGVAAVTVLIALIPDPDAFITATLLNLTEIGNRPDSQSLSGLLASQGIDFFLSPVAWIALGLTLSALLGIGSRSVSDLIGRVGLTMGLVFFFGQGFPNYWFFVLALMAVGAVLASRGDTDAGRTTSDAIRATSQGSDEGYP